MSGVDIESSPRRSEMVPDISSTHMRLAAECESAFKLGELHALEGGDSSVAPFQGDEVLTGWWQRGTSYGARLMRAQEAERQRDAAVAKLTPTIKKLNVEDDVATMTLTDPYKLTAIIARSLRSILDSSDPATLNYIEMSFKEQGNLQPLVVAVARSQAQTPHELRLKAEQERDEAREDCAAQKDRADALQQEVARLIAEHLRMDAEMTTATQKIHAMRAQCLLSFDDPTGPWGWECADCGARYTQGAGPGKFPDKDKAREQVKHISGCAFAPSSATTSEVSQ